MIFLKRYILGFSILFRGADYFLGHKALRRLALWPLLLAVTLLFLGIYSVVQWIPWLQEFFLAQLTQLVGPFESWWWQALFWLAGVFLYLASFFMVLGSTYFIALVLAIPFNAQIAEKTLELKGFTYHEPKSWRDWLAFNLQMAYTAVWKLLLLLVLAVPIFVISLIPGVGWLAGLYGVFLVAYDSLDYALELKAYKFSQRLAFVRQYFPELLGYSTLIAVFMVLPLVNLLLLPLLICSGSLFVGQELESKTPSRSG